MVSIAFSVEAFEAIAQTLPLGSVGYENAFNERGERYVWLAPNVVDRLKAMRSPGESYSDVILRVAKGMEPKLKGWLNTVGLLLGMLRIIPVSRRCLDSRRLPRYFIAIGFRVISGTAVQEFVEIVECATATIDRAFLMRRALEFRPLKPSPCSPNEPRARPGRSERLTSMVYLTSTETRTLAGLVLRWLAPEMSNENSSGPLYPGDDLYDTSG